MEHSYHLSKAGTQESACSWPPLEKERKSSAPPQARGPPQGNDFADARGLGPGLSVKAAEVFSLLPSGLGFGVVESPVFTGRHPGTISKVTWGHPCRRG